MVRRSDQEVNCKSEAANALPPIYPNRECVAKARHVIRSETGGSRETLRDDAEGIGCRTSAGRQKRKDSSWFQQGMMIQARPSCVRRFTNQ